MTQDSFSLKGKSAYILGGSGLIGREISLEFTRLGAKVLILDNNKKRSISISSEMKRYNQDSAYCFFDCSDMDNIENHLEEIISVYSVPHIFINCSYLFNRSIIK